jgi:hypothetical protein
MHEAVRASPVKGKLADVGELRRARFGASLRRRLAMNGEELLPRKRWELFWLAQAFDALCGSRRLEAMLGLGVGHEPLIYHFAHLCDNVIATDLHAADPADAGAQHGR